MIRTHLQKALAPLALGAVLAIPFTALAQDQPAPKPVDQDQAETEKKETEEEREKRKIREAQARLKKVEEQFLKAQIETQINQIAKWDKETGEIVLRKSGDLGGAEIPVELLLERLCEPQFEGARLKIKDDVQIRPFAIAIQNYMAKGGMQDIEKIQKGEGNPFADGVPDRMWVAIAGLLDALNAQDELTEEQIAAEAAAEEQRLELQRQVAEGLGLDGENVELRAQILRKLIVRAERDLRDGRTDAFDSVTKFAESARAERLFRKMMGSETVINTVEQLEKGLERLLTSEQGQRLQERLFEALESDQGRDLVGRIQELLDSEAGQKAQDRLEGLRRLLDEERQKRGEDEPKAEQSKPKREKKADKPAEKRDDKKKQPQGSEAF
ncbi:MAG: hypothetical protein ACYS22_05550 [Planctomycetota bacterium]